jgi:hypothetical protein
MTHQPRRPLRTAIFGLAALLLVSGGIVSPGARAGATFADGKTAMGISDSDPSTFKSPYWSNLNVIRARAVVAWDLAEQPPGNVLEPRTRAYFEDWLAQVRRLGIEPFVVFARSRYHHRVDGDPSSGYRAPTDAEFERAFRAFRATYPDVRLFGAWNEPNFDPEDPAGKIYTADRRNLLSDHVCETVSTDSCGPLAAAFFWRRAHAVCPECTIVAGEFTSTPNDPYWTEYKRYLRSHRPAVWSVHPWVDANRYQQLGSHCQPGDLKCVTRTFLAQLQGEWVNSHIWLTEVGAYRTHVCWGLAAEYRANQPECADPNAVHVFSQQSQAEAADFITRLPTISSRITRVYYYDFQDHCDTPAACNQNDSSLMSDMDSYPVIGGSPRAAFCVIRDRGLNQPPYPNWPC